MRNLFLALVLANLGFAAWHAWFANDAPPTPAARAAPSITLVSELPAEGCMLVERRIPLRLHQLACALAGISVIASSPAARA